MLIIHSNGSKWLGQEPDTIETLLDVLSNHTLDPTFENYGDFIQPNPRSAVYIGLGKYADKRPIYPENPHTVRFFGNFFELSHVFLIDTDDHNIIEKLTLAIEKNKATASYQQAKKERLSN